MLSPQSSHRRPRFVASRGLALCRFTAFSGALLLCSPALASDITIASPVNGTQVSSPVWIRAHTIGCEGVPPTAFGYSIDNSRAIVRGESPYDIDLPHQAIAAGTHTVHFRSWTARGACPVVSTQFTAGAASNASSPATPSAAAAYGVPGNAVSSGDLDGKRGWSQIHDGGTPGSSRGSSVYPASTPVYDDARKFYMTYTDRAGERWSIDAARDSRVTHFVVDTYIYLPNPSEVMNLELDINQVIANDETVILSSQCAGNDGRWEAGYTSGRLDHWWASGIKCDPRNWTPKVWHHIQIGMHRGANGVVTHDWVDVDGAHHVWGYTRESAHFLGWAPATVNVQYQIEGANKGSGVVTSYIHKLTVYRW